MKREITIGRATSNDIVLDNQNVSKFHAKLVFETNGSLWIYDLNSTNGTFVNGQKISGSKQLRANDEIRLGSYVFDWQSLLLVESEELENTNEPVKPQKQANYEAEANYVPRNKKSMNLTPIVLVIAVVGLFVFGYSQDFWGVFDSVLSSDNGPENDWKKTNKELEYSVACLRDSSVIGNTVGVLNDVKKEIIKGENVEVSIKEEMNIGKEVKKQMDRTYSYSKNPMLNNRIDAIVKRLLGQLKSRGFNYNWYIIEAKEINAFTAGGEIFITTGMIDFAISDDELACIIGHEIYHNELGHIRDKLKEIKIANNIFGEGFGEIAAAASNILGTSFNQENEAYCDMYGLDLAVKAGYHGCAAIELWNRMSEKESDDGEFSKLFRSHPYSKERSRCIHHHIDHNYKKSCSSH